MDVCVWLEAVDGWMAGWMESLRALIPSFP
jgi:hypothetical protein